MMTFSLLVVEREGEFLCGHVLAFFVTRLDDLCVKLNVTPWRLLSVNRFWR